VRPCPKCAAVPGESCRTHSGREASRIHDGAAAERHGGGHRATPFELGPHVVAREELVSSRAKPFAGQPLIVGTVVWTAADRLVVIEARRGDERFEELV